MRQDQDPGLSGPGLAVAEPGELLVGYLRWYREALRRKLAGLGEEQLRTPLAATGWAPLALVQHLGWMEHRWLRWGLRAEQVDARPPGGLVAEWRVDRPTADIWATYDAQTAAADEILDGLAPWTALATRAAVGGRFTRPDTAPPLSRILVHLLQEYARHLGHLDIARQLLDGHTGE
ncbi:hypothetical protein GCM10010124_23200 [Pilimelia terevasa]|uniref:Mini-circle protein n=1 Tax=Pilimelia terevasa TaxID=53372 RepID=A0A8J3FJN0_9ACTN|nr:DUF664 domain-containing protein [Pilimelia terevasa]GGK29838.1 hypothetical protein GCM10010124_23200 [Pilimelia terevasa]